MKPKRHILLILSIFLVNIVNAQTITLTFTGENNYYHVPLDSILIVNITQGGDTMLYKPDTVLILQNPTGINDYSKRSFELQNFPNPFESNTSVNIYIPESNQIEILISNTIGQKVVSYSDYLSGGNHNFMFHSGCAGIYYLTTKYKSEIKTIKLISQSSREQDFNFIYEGKSWNTPIQKKGKSINGFVFNAGDQLKYIGYAGHGQDTLFDFPVTNFSYTFDFLMGCPCPLDPSVTYGGQTYKTVIIGTQCWFAENLNIGTRIDGSIVQTNNGIIEKYCYDDLSALCNTFGGLYRWNEMMQYDTSIKQGICPVGWHIPSDNEWTTLVDYLGGESIAGGKMKETTLTNWNAPNTGANNFSGFTGLPAGYCDGNTHLSYFIGNNVYFMSSTESNFDRSWNRHLHYDSAEVTRFANLKNSGFSVRCLKD